MECGRYAARSMASGSEDCVHPGWTISTSAIVWARKERFISNVIFAQNSQNFGKNNKNFAQARFLFLRIVIHVLKIGKTLVFKRLY